MDVSDLVELNLIGKLLEKKGIKSKWLAKELDVHVNTVSKWVNNEQQPHLKIFLKISILLQCDIRELIVSTAYLLGRPTQGQRK